jgi:osmotically-inducible protein OsmY
MLVYNINVRIEAKLLHAVMHVWRVYGKLTLGSVPRRAITNYFQETLMKSFLLPGMLISAVLIAGCASTGNSATSASPAQAAASATNTDATITQKVKDSLQGDPDTAGQKYNVDTAQGKVTLKGEVKSVAAYRKAPVVAKAVPGVIAVDNQLVVCLTCK